MKGVSFMDVILLAAGIGKRAKLNCPKQFMRLGGKPLIVRSVELFCNIPKVEKIIITVIPGEEEYFSSIIKDYCCDKCIYVQGGKTRQESVYNALQKCSSDRVIIHETVRPFATQELVERLMSEHGAAIVPCLPSTSTVFYKNDFLERDNVLDVQLPQVFDTQILKKAHKIAKGKNYTDDSSLVFYELGIKPVIIDGLEENIKITTPLDILIAEVIYNETCSRNRRE